MIQTLTTRIMAQPIHRHYITPAPLWRAVAFALVPAFLAPAASQYFHVDPVCSGGLSVLVFSIGLVIGSTQVEETEIENEPPDDDEPESEPEVAEPVRVEEVTRQFKNSVSIRWPHEPPHDTDHKAQIRLSHADLALAKAATDKDNPLMPISWPNVQKRRMGIGEPTFYRIERHWLKEGLAFKTNSGAVYLKPSGIKTLTQYANQ